MLRHRKERDDVSQLDPFRQWVMGSIVHGDNIENGFVISGAIFIAFIFFVRNGNDTAVSNS